MKKILITLASILLLLILTNPSIQRFKEYKAILPDEDEKVLYSRKANCILFSIYESKIAGYDRFGKYNEREKKKYIGVIMNFFEQ